ncbi:MAG: hypothetical protein WC604_00085 [Candidatus Gracilibacteria bacterium]
MNYKENRLVYKDFEEFVDEAWGDIRSAASKVWGPLERGANWIGHNVDNLNVRYLASDKPDPLEDSTEFSDSYWYYHNLEIRYTGLYNDELLVYKGFERQLLECERLKEITDNEIKQLKEQIGDIPQQVEQHKKAQNGFYSSTPIYKHHGEEIQKTVDNMVSLKTDLKAKYDTTFPVVSGEDPSGGAPMTNDLSLDKAIAFLELKLKEIEPGMDYYEDNMKRAAYWAQRALEVEGGKAEGEKELAVADEDQLLTQFESLNYDFEGTYGAELASRKSFAQEVIKLCEEKAFSISELEWKKIFTEGENIDYDGSRVETDARNLKALEAVENWIDKYSK